MNEQQIRHIIIIEDPRGKRKIELKDTVYSIGRHSRNSIIVASRQVSRFHATILKKPSENHRYSFWIIDGDLNGQKSQNGIFVNGQRCWVRELKHGDVINICDVKASYYFLGETQERLLKAKKEEENEILFSDELQTTPALIAEVNLEELTTSELGRLASFVKLSPYPIIEIDFSGKITYLNPVAKEIFPDLEEVKLEHPLLVNLFAPPFQNFSREVKVGEQLFTEYLHFLPERKLVRIYAFKTTEKLTQEGQFYDKTTGLPNQILFNEYVTFALENAITHNRWLALMLVGFPENIAEEKVAKILSKSCGEKKSVAQIENNIFAVLFPEIIKIEELGKISQTILQTFKEPLAEKQPPLPCNIGIAVYPQDGETVETLLKAANAGLCRSQKQGENNYQFYNRKLNFESGKLFQLEKELVQALEEKQLILYYQPQYDLNTGDICGLEALLRWQHPARGLVSPLEFIPGAAKIGLIVKIGEWVLETAAAQNKAWQNAGLRPVKIGVNIAEKQFEAWNLVKTISQILKKTGLEPQWLELEITENSLIGNWDSVQKTLPPLLQMGVNLCFDDFGIGYSSLGYFKQFSFHTLKIAQGFIEDLEDNPQDRAIVATAIALGQGFNLRVIAEGVETPEQLEILRSLQCSLMQGYLFSEPLIAEEVTELLTAYSSETSCPDNLEI